jgi:hypothetical protein
MNDPAQRLLDELDTIVAAHPGIAAHGVAVLNGTTAVALAGFCGTTFAAPDTIAKLLDDLPPPPALLVTNDPYAGGVALDHVFLLGRAGSRTIVAALAFRDFGAMRKDVFRHRAETFHEGLSLSLLPVDWTGPDRDVVLNVIAANVRDGAAIRAFTDKVARATLAACNGGDWIASDWAPLPAILGHADSRAVLANSNDAAIDVRLQFSENGWRLRISLDSKNPAAVARCAASAIRSATMLGVADALSLPRATLLHTLNVDDVGVAAVAPEAVGDGAPLAFACYRAAFDAARTLGRTAASPRDEAAFLARQ